MWLKYEGFKDLQKGWWQGLNFRGSYSYVLAAKLKALKGILKVRNKEVFGNVGTKKAKALRRVSFWDNIEKERELSLAESEERVKARDYYKKWSLLEEISWRQKSRELWLKDGDRNTSFFHRMANSHRRRNALKNIRINDSWFTEDYAIQKGVVDAFQNLLSDQGMAPWFPNIPFDFIDEEDSNRIEGKFTEDEVLVAISGLNGEKASGLNGFSIVF